ncbi:hypothetical protein [Tabrizicola sp.]|uniref:hypothetical protein n=1 Tax=Tabrizicola sp. TaxID=2005166 RepID=UPI0025FDE599|nr:hypothetical protein [Tabrizicola sp.]
MSTASAHVTTALPAGPWKRRQVRVLGWLAGFWLISDLGYYFGLPSLGVGMDYNLNPMPVATFYLFWSGLAAIVFWPLYSRWNADGPFPTLRNRVLAALIWTATFALILVFLHWGLPALPEATWPADLGEPPDLLIATPAYFFPKTVEIVFQQLLVLALIVSLSLDGLPLRTISIFAALLFGGMHILLAFSGIPPRAVIMFIVAATAFGLILPRLILKTRFGLAAAFVLHWTFYAAVLAQARIFGPHIASSVVG